MKAFVIYKTIPHYDEFESDIIVAKNLFSDERCYLQYDNGLEILKDEEFNKFVEIEKNNEVDDATKQQIINYVKEHSKITEETLNTKSPIYNNLKTLKVLNGYDMTFCAYNIVGNEIRISEKQSSKNAMLAHEVGHMEFSECKLDLKNKKFYVYSGVIEQMQEITNVKTITNQNDLNYVYVTPKEYAIIESKPIYTKNIGLEEFLNDVKSSKIEYNSVYPSIGKIIETLVGEKTCLTARKEHNVLLINEKLLKIIPNKEKLQNLYNKMDSYFTVKKTDKPQSEQQLFEAIAPYVENYLKANKNLTKTQKDNLTNWHFVYKINELENN